MKTVLQGVYAVLAACVVAGCATEPQRPVVAEIRTVEVRVPIPVPCVASDKIPERPRTALPEASADIARKAAGASAEVRALDQQNKELRALLLACAK